MENFPDSLDSSVKKSEYDFSTEQIHFKRSDNVDIMYLTDSAAEILKKILTQTSPSDANLLWPQGKHSTQKIRLTFTPTNNNWYLIWFQSSASVLLWVFSFENDVISLHTPDWIWKIYRFLDTDPLFLLGLFYQIEQYDLSKQSQLLSWKSQIDQPSVWSLIIGTSNNVNATF